jgi:hypothetical protein
MEENRSFDHMVGWFKGNFPLPVLPSPPSSLSCAGVNGLTGNEYNLVNVSIPNSARVYVDDKGISSSPFPLLSYPHPFPSAPFVALCDPDHSTAATTFKVYGSK